VDLSIFAVEAALVKQAFSALPPEVRRDAARRAAAGDDCCMIDPADGRCIVYPARPIICRSHGMTILIDGRLDHCPKNYTGRTATRDCILDIEKLNAALVSVNAAAGCGDARVRIADIALRNA
jgi:Fe-S-cluster containining protein